MEQIVLYKLQAKSGRDFDGDVRKFIETSGLVGNQRIFALKGQHFPLKAIPFCFGNFTLVSNQTAN